MLVAVVIGFALLGAIATWGLVIRALRDLRPKDSPAAQARIAHQTRMLALLALTGFAVTFAATWVLQDLLDIADDSMTGFLLFGAVWIISISPAAILAKRYGDIRARRDG